MSKWYVVSQVENRKGESFDVDCKLMRWRPANAKEQAEGDDFKPMRTTLCVKFSHELGNGEEFKITSQFRRGQWQYNLHEPERIVPKEVRTKSAKMVTRQTDEMTVKKESTGSMAEATFRRVFSERVRDTEFVNKVMGLFAERQGGDKAAEAA